MRHLLCTVRAWDSVANSSQPQIAEAGMIVRAAPERPPILAIRFFDRKIVDTGEPEAHQAVIGEFPVLVAVRAEPVSRVVVPFVGEADGYAIAIEGPQLFDQPVVQLPRPLASEKRDDLLAAARELGAVSPARIRRVGEGDLLGVTGVPAILGQSDLLNGRVSREGRSQGGCGHSRHSSSYLSRAILDSRSALLHAGWPFTIRIRSGRCTSAPGRFIPFRRPPGKSALCSPNI